MTSAGEFAAARSADHRRRTPWITNRTRSRIQRTSRQRLVAVELHRVQPDPVRDLDDALGPVVRNTPTVSTSRGNRLTMSRTRSGCTWRRARREHEADRVGAQRDREQRVLLVRDPADLDEHVRPLSARPAPRARARTSAAGSSARTSASPTSTASNPAAAIRSRVGGDCAPRTRRRATTSAGSSADSDSAHAEVLGERGEVAAVDADDARAGRERALDLGLVVRLDEHAEAELGRERVQIGEQRVVGQRGHDQQDRVGADRRAS